MASGNSKTSTDKSKDPSKNPSKNTNKKSGKERAAERRAKIEEQRRAEQARERRNRIITIAASAAILAGVAFGGWYLVDSANDKEAAEVAAKAAPIAGVKTFKKLTQNHVDKPVDYPMTPAAGGDHSAAWQNCDGDVYTTPIANENAVHSLEHGAVWVTYNDKASKADVKALSAKVDKTPYTLMSPLAEQSSPITLTAWGAQLNVEKESDPKVGKFLEKYVQGEQTPEPGAPCTGGKSA
ncbi:DUF3105 domain-containing protein [Streptomyces cavernae]|uniref:DUF3105 domain-containing protein n=1 Tax=Streptomyces cavernae TaxID=2259034 RepID=UPI000FEC0D20|nr:DUF3105 domain-containing protein [Streptomyces cavernae]